MGSEQECASNSAMRLTTTSLQGETARRGTEDLKKNKREFSSSSSNRRRHRRVVVVVVVVIVVV